MIADCKRRNSVVLSIAILAFATRVEAQDAMTRASVDSSGNQGDQDSAYGGSVAISADGRYVAFDSQATNLVASDTNGAGDVFVHDRITGATVRVSVDSSGAQGNYGSYRPSISADGRFVAFMSYATNLVAGDTNGTFDIFVHDRDPDGNGIFDEGNGITTCVSVDATGVPGNGESDDCSI